jgi:uncharacterized protein (TIGR03435 family)
VARRLLGILMNWTILLIAALAAQSLQFEVASIKPHPRVQGRGSVVPQALRMEPTGLNYTNASLLACIQAAYGIPGEGRPDYRIVGGPDWLTTERFDIDAKSDGPASREQMMQMLQTLLADRFKLKAHHETRELRAYALTTGKSEPKIARAKPDETEMFLQRRKDDPAGPAQELVVQRNTLSRFADYLAPVQERWRINSGSDSNRFERTSRCLSSTTSNELPLRIKATPSVSSVLESYS